jgi:hypothetical protein
MAGLVDSGLVDSGLVDSVLVDPVLAAIPILRSPDAMRTSRCSEVNSLPRPCSTKPVGRRPGLTISRQMADAVAKWARY